MVVVVVNGRVVSFSFACRFRRLRCRMRSKYFVSRSRTLHTNLSICLSIYISSIQHLRLVVTAVLMRRSRSLEIPTSDYARFRTVICLPSFSNLLSLPLLLPSSPVQLPSVVRWLPTCVTLCFWYVHTFVVVGIFSFGLLINLMSTEL